MDCSWETGVFCQRFDELPADLVHTLQHGTNSAFLAALSATALEQRYTLPVFTLFEPLALELGIRWTSASAINVIPALGRIVPILPHLSGLAQRVLQSFSSTNDLLSICLHEATSINGVHVDSDAANIREFLLGIYRLLEFDNHTFAEHIKPAKLQIFLQHDNRSVRYLSIRLICQYIHASDAVMEDMISKYLGTERVNGQWEDREIDYLFLALWEHKRQSDTRQSIALLRRERLSSNTTSSLNRIIEQQDLASEVVNICGVLHLRSASDHAPNPADTSFIATPTTTANLEKLSKAILTPDPVLVTGLPSSGKTSLVRHLAMRCGKLENMVTLHLNEQSDAKLLIGIYSTGSQPGSFEWKPGVLTNAVRQGRWLFIEDLDRAPNDIMSVLLPLMERGELAIPSRGEKLRAAPGFRIIATMQTTLNLQGFEIVPTSRMLGQRLWNHVAISTPTTTELSDIILERHPSATKFMPRIMAVYNKLVSLTRTSLSAGNIGRTRSISARELYGWCGRLAENLTHAGMETGNEQVPENVMDAIFLDAVDCFTGSLEDGRFRDTLIAAIAEEMYIAPKRRDHMLQDRCPALKRFNTDFRQECIIGRAILPVIGGKHATSFISKTAAPFALNAYSLRLLEQVAVSVRRKEPLLLVGETGIGKTTVIQHLAQLTGQQLLAINLSQQSESSDLLGGFKPVNMRSIVIPLKDEFDLLFEATFSNKRNQRFVDMLAKSIAKSQWRRSVTLWKEALKMVEKVIKEASAQPVDLAEEQPAKKRKLKTPIGEREQAKWADFADRITSLESRLGNEPDASIFTFVEGKLVKAVRDGQWVLLDEINLATSDTLECLMELLESGPNAQPSILLTESGNTERIQAHPDFRIFAAMNPATDVGKKDLPLGVRSRFTEIYVNSPDRDLQSLQSIVKLYLDRTSPTGSDTKLVAIVTELYRDIQTAVKDSGLVDGSGQRPHYSLRTLTRTLSHAVATAPRCSLRRALFEGFSMCFLTPLNGPSEDNLLNLIKTRLLKNEATTRVELSRPLRQPEDGNQYISVEFRVEACQKGSKSSLEQHWVAKGHNACEDSAQYIVTPFIARNLRNLVRAASTRKHPILIQGPTSAGKTSMVEYLAKRSGNTFIRINNHEHTDLQEYLGSYVSTNDGQLVFQEGLLVQAVRAGHWVVLDELNLAPTDVLEALNRLLDENRELFIPETQEIIRPHPDFMLFATQNPVGPYGGRKMLSRAFRNRFLELHFDDIPVEELNTILARRSQLPESWCALIVEVYKRLSQMRQEQRLFEQHSFATLRDLFRWAFRGANSVEELADNGYMLLAEKVRKEEDRLVVRTIIQQVMSRKGVKINIDDAILYTEGRCVEMVHHAQKAQGPIVWTKAMRRLFVLVAHAIRNNEAILLVGETGCGKTTVCQMLAEALQQPLHIVNAHQNTDTGDLIGAQRPVRGRASIEQQLLDDLDDVLSVDGRPAYMDVEEMLTAFDDALKSDRLQNISTEKKARIEVNRVRRKALFEWSDGSLVQAMRAGDLYLLDEISLAEDSVLERMNSVLDPQRSILLAEKGTSDSLVSAKQGFQFFATMNPGGDFGKKELSPALRNRFTEIWVPPMTDTDDISQIVLARLTSSAAPVAEVLVRFATWFGERYSVLKASTVSIRDVLAWISFINSQNMDLPEAVIQGAAMVYIDTLGANPAALLAVSGDAIERERQACLQTLSDFTGHNAREIYYREVELEVNDHAMILGPFSMTRVNDTFPDTSFNFQAPTTKVSAMRILRALQVAKPILLEGSPGVGKTSIISAIAHVTGRTLARLNLSEQTDLMDLFGSDVPVENGEPGHFAWRDASFLTAMKLGHWVLLDEMNLASQSVLEGLNACLDHRGEVYVAELGQTFSKHPDFRLFAAQNPHHQGGGRKGLPASFVNRFTVVYADMFKQEDLQLICTNSYPTTDVKLIADVVKFVVELDSQVSIKHSFGARGSPWEFNLRDTLRYLQLLSSTEGMLTAGNARDFLETLFMQRFRSQDDLNRVKELFHDIIKKDYRRRDSFTNLTTRSIQVGLGFVPRRPLLQYSGPLKRIDSSPRLLLLESLLVCVQQTWPVILVGPSGSGKTQLLHELAALVGTDIETFSLNADIDATDLVGGYEQADPSRQLVALLVDIRDCFRTLISSNLAIDSTEVVDLLLEGLQYIQNVHASEIALSQVGQMLSNIAEHVSSPEVISLLERSNNLQIQPQSVGTGKFEWIEGTLIKALQYGQWLVLDNANLCSSSVLDRLNALLEPNGSLIVTEHPDENGVARVITPHPNFRIFMTMDPQYGEVSRAMRNRAVELYVSPFQEEQQLAYGSTQRAPLLLESRLFRFQQFLSVCRQVAGQATPEMVLDAACESFSFSDLKQWYSFADQAEQSLLDANSHAVFRACLGGYESMTELYPDWQVAPLAFYKNALSSVCKVSADEVFDQSIHTLANQPIVNISPNTSSNPYWLGKVFELLLDLSRMRQALEAIRSTSVSTMLSRLDRSFASDRMPESAKDSTHWVAPFLTNSMNMILQWAIDASGQGTGDMSTMKFIAAVKIFWWAMLRLCSTDEFQEAHFQVYLSLGTSTIASAKATGSQSVVLLAGLAEQLRGFRSRAQLTTGLSMERIWAVCKPGSISSLSRLEALVQLEALADRFDTLVWKTKASFEELYSVHVSIAHAIDVIRSGTMDVGSLIEDLESLLAELVIHNTATNDKVVPYFGAVFEGLSQYQSLGGDGTRTGYVDDRLSFVASRSTKSIYDTTSWSKSARLLNTITKYAGPSDHSHGSVAFIGSLAHVTKQHMRNISEVKLRQQALLQHEISILGSSFAKAERDLCSSQPDAILPSVRAILIAIISAQDEVLQTPFDFSITASTRDVETFLNQLTAHSTLPESVAFSRIAKTAFQPLLALEMSLNANSHLDVGHALVKFAIGCLLLYVPNRPFDPALRAQIQSQFHSEHLHDLRKRLEALSIAEIYTTGQTSNLRCDVVKQDIEDLGSAPPVPEIARPVISKLSELSTEFAGILRLVDRVEKEISHTSMNNENILIGISRIIQRLQQDYRAYEDITMPVVGFLSCLRLGLEVLPSVSADNARTDGDEFSEGALIPFTSLNAGQSLRSKRPISFAGLSSQKCITYLQKLAFVSSIEQIITWPVDWQATIPDLMDLQYSRWKSQLSEDQRKAAAASSIYHFKGSAEDEEEVDDEQFRSLFPNFEDDEASTDDLKSTNQDKSQSPQGLAATVASLHMKLFSPTNEPAKELEAILKHHTRQAEATKTSTMQASLPAIYLSLQDIKLGMVQAEKVTVEYNIYTDGNIREAQRITLLVEEIQIAFMPILETWPEHATLHSILDICNELLSFRHVEPVMKIITKAEKLHDAIAEWQTIASRQYSRPALFDKLTDIIVSWRQLELSTWAKLLDVELKRCKEDAMSWWFIAYENVVAGLGSVSSSPEILGDHTRDLLATLEIFLRNSAIGQFETRLKMLRSLVLQLRMQETSEPWLGPVRAALSNLLDHFQRFTSALDSVVIKGREKLEKEIRNVIQLASWKDRNINVLKQSAKASHRKLFKVVRKFRAVLAQPAAPILVQDAPAFVMNDDGEDQVTMSVEISTDRSESIRTVCQDESSLWDSRPVRFKDIASTIVMMRSRTAPAVRDIDGASKLRAFVEDLLASISHLQKATPGTLTEENTPIVKHLTNQKRILFADTLRAVREMGMKSNVSADTLASQDCLATVLSKTPSLLDLKSFTKVAQAEDQMHRILQIMPAVRGANIEHSEDLNKGDVVRSIGYLESMLQLCLKQRRDIARSLASYDSLKTLVRRVDNLWTHREYQALSKTTTSTSSNMEIDFIRAQLHWLPPIIRVGNKILAAQADLGKLDFTELIQSLEHAAQTLDDLRKEMTELPDMAAGLSSFAESSLIARYTSENERFRTHLEEQINDRAHGKVVLQHVLAWVNPPADTEAKDSGMNGQDHKSLQDAIQQQYETLDLVLGSIQDVAKAQQQLPMLTNEPAWLIKDDAAKAGVLSAFHPGVISDAIEKSLEALHCVEDSPSNLLILACASLASALPIFQQYLAAFSTALASGADLHAATCEMTYKLAKSFNVIASQGLCKPAEKSNDKAGTSDKLEAGTGLGEGEGAEDISKDIGADEDLTDLAQDVDTTGQDRDMQKADDAVDIEDEMEGGKGADKGELEDEEDGEKKEGSDIGEEGEVGSTGGGDEGEEAEGEDAMDEDVGSVDDLGPSAVDEKLWDQAADENAKEKEGQQELKSAAEDDKSAAGKEDKSKKDTDLAEGGEEPEGADADREGLDDDMSDQESDVGGPAQPEVMDPHLKEEEGLELPDELQLDGDKSKNEDDFGEDTDEEILDDADRDAQDTRGEEGAEPEDEIEQENIDKQAMETAADAMQEKEDQEQNLADPDAPMDERQQQNPQSSGGGQDQDALADADNEQQIGEASDPLKREKQEQQDLNADASAENKQDLQEDQSTSAASAQRSTGAQSQSATELQPASGQQNSNDETDSQPQPQPQESRDAQTIRKLGSVLEKWHRQHRDIREQATERPEELAPRPDDVDMADAEYEHLPDENADADTQALGAASKEQTRALDESMAMEDEERVGERNLQDTLPEELEVSEDEEEDEMDVDEEHAAAPGGYADEQIKDTQPQSFVSKQGLPIEDKPTADRSEEDEDHDLDLTTVNSALSATHLSSPPSLTLDPQAGWALHTSRTASLSLLLTEHLRLILAPTHATKLRGDFRTGKRLNMKRIIPYIASQYKRDRIWLRRSAPSKRRYQILLAIDDSGSMVDEQGQNGGDAVEAGTGGAAMLAFDTLALISRSLSALESGELGVLAFGSDVTVAHDLSLPFAGDAGPQALRHFTFTQQRTDVKRLVERSIEIFREARQRGVNGAGGGGGEELWQLELVVSDGICEDHEGIRRLLVQAMEERIMIVFIIVDAASPPSSTTGTTTTPDTTNTGAGTKPAGQSSILDLERVEFVPVPGTGGEGQTPEMKIQRKKYLETFPFGYYLVVRDVMELPGVLATALRQWFAEVVER